MQKTQTFTVLVTITAYEDHPIFRRGMLDSVTQAAVNNGTIAPVTAVTTDSFEGDHVEDHPSRRAAKSLHAALQRP